MSQVYLIDTDTGSDDAVALLMAFRNPEIEVVGVTAVAGNVPVRQAARNALVVAELCAHHVPVYIGAEQPLIRPYHDASHFHGVDGLGDVGYPDPVRQPEDEHAVSAMIRLIRANPGLTLVTLGPLTNVALALRQAPDIAGLVGRCVVMGGAACTFGNTTPVAEYNIWCDPEAARMVFHSGLPVEMVGWEFCIGEYALDEDEIGYLQSLDTPYSHFTVDCNTVSIEAYKRQMGVYGISLPDPVTMAIAFDPSIATQTKHFVEVATGDELTRGMTIVDKLNAADDEYNQSTWAHLIRNGRRIAVTWDVDAVRWKHILYRYLK